MSTGARRAVFGLAALAAGCSGTDLNTEAFETGSLHAHFRVVHEGSPTITAWFSFRALESDLPVPLGPGDRLTVVEPAPVDPGAAPPSAVARIRFERQGRGEVVETEYAVPAPFQAGVAFERPQLGFPLTVAWSPVVPGGKMHVTHRSFCVRSRSWGEVPDTGRTLITLTEMPVGPCSVDILLDRAHEQSPAAPYASLSIDVVRRVRVTAQLR